MSPAPTRSTSARASSATTSKLRSRFAAGPELSPLRPPSLSSATRLGREALSVGTSPNTRAATLDSAAAKPSTRTSNSKLSQKGRGIGIAVTMASLPQRPRTTPAAPPARPRTRFSTASWRTSRPRGAPRARRMAISFERETPRASRRLVMLRQAIRNTNITAPNSRPVWCLVSWSVCSRIGPSRNLTPLLVCGYSEASRAAMASSSACASWGAMPGCRRARPENMKLWRWSVLPASGRRGVQTSVRSGYRQPAGITPTIVVGSPLSVTTVPMVSSLAPKRAFQSLALMRATGGDSAAASGAAKLRPRMGETPSCEKASQDICVPICRSGISEPAMITVRSVCTQKPVRVVTCRWMSKNSGYDRPLAASGRAGSTRARVRNSCSGIVTWGSGLK